MKTRIEIPAITPRNPFATLGRKRLAGAHRRGKGALRQGAARELRRELTRLRDTT